jgi:hypothetical protein
MLSHLKDTYGQVAPDDVEKNRNFLSEEWNPDEPIENILLHICDCQAFTAPIEPITDGVAMRLTLFEHTSVFAFLNIPVFLRLPLKNCVISPSLITRSPISLPTSISRTKSASASSPPKPPVSMAHTSGYHSCFSPNATAIIAAAAAAAPVVVVVVVVVVDEIRMYYCHTHGLGKSAAHTSATCANPGADHKTGATISNMMGGNNEIMSWPRQLHLHS